MLSYLQAKWTPSGTYVQHGGRKHHDPDAIDIGKVGDKGAKCGRGNRKGGKGKGDGKGKGKEKGKEGKGKGHRTGHTAKECWYNTKGQGKGQRAAVSAPYRIVNGVEYLSSNCKFGETVMTKLPKPANKAQKRWIRGVRVGKLDTHTHIYIYILIYIYIYPPVHKYKYIDR